MKMNTWVRGWLTRGARFKGATEVRIGVRGDLTMKQNWRKCAVVSPLTRDLVTSLAHGGISWPDERKKVESGLVTQF